MCRTFQIPDCSLTPEISSSALFGIYDLCITGAHEFLRTRGNRSKRCVTFLTFAPEDPFFPKKSHISSGPFNALRCHLCPENIGPSTPGKSLFRTSNPFVVFVNFVNSFLVHLPDPNKPQEDKGSSLSPPWKIKDFIVFPA